MKNSSASLFLQKKMKCLLFSPENSWVHRYFYRKKTKHLIISSEKMELLPISSEKKSSTKLFLQKKMFFFRKKRHLIFILKRSWGALFFSEEILRHLIFVCEELMRRLMFFWRRHEALGLVASIFLLMLFLQWQNQVPQYFFRRKHDSLDFCAAEITSTGLLR